MSAHKGSKRGTAGAGLFFFGLFAASQGGLAQSNSADRLMVDPIPAIKPFYIPMTEQERLHQYFKDTLNPTALLSAGAAAGIGQWRNRPENWGLGAEGYSRRLASAFTEHFERETLLFGLSSAFHEDNRYVPSGLSSKGGRVAYAVKSTFTARHNDGTRHVSFSRLAAFAGAAALSRLWQPAGYRGVRSGLANLSTSVSVAVGFNVAREFLPQIIH